MLEEALYMCEIIINVEKSIMKNYKQSNKENKYVTMTKSSYKYYS